MEAEAAARYLDAMVHRLAEKGVVAETRLSARPAVEAILDEVERAGADLVVMGTHGRSGPGRWVYGSTAEGVLARCTVPLLLIRPQSQPPADGPATGRPRLLVPLDGSRFAEAILPHAVACARHLSATLALLRVVETPRPLLGGLDAPVQDWWAGGGAVQRGEAERYLDDVAERLRADGLRVKTTVRVAPTVGEAILQEGRAESVQLILMATHGHSGLSRLLFGSTAAEVLQRGLPPLLLLRPGGLEPAAPLPALSRED
jgi:nucleotide-binding universal stress UspA family protein